MTLADLLADWAMPTLAGLITGFVVGLVVGLRFKPRRREDPSSMSTPTPTPKSPEAAPSITPDASAPVHANVVAEVRTPGVVGRLASALIAVLAIVGLVAGGVSLSSLTRKGECQADYNSAVGSALRERAAATTADRIAAAADRRANRELLTALLFLDPGLPPEERQARVQSAYQAYIAQSERADAAASGADATRQAFPYPDDPGC